MEHLVARSLALILRVCVRLAAAVVEHGDHRCLITELCALRKRKRLTTLTSTL
jgi:hypothetical protein